MSVYDLKPQRFLKMLHSKSENPHPRLIASAMAEPPDLNNFDSPSQIWMEPLLGNLAWTISNAFTTSFEADL